MLRSWFELGLSAAATAGRHERAISPPIAAIWRTSVAVMVRTGAGRQKHGLQSGAMVSFMPAICIS